MWPDPGGSHLHALSFILIFPSLSIFYFLFLEQKGLGNTTLLTPLPLLGSSQLRSQDSHVSGSFQLSMTSPA